MVNLEVPHWLIYATLVVYLAGFVLGLYSTFEARTPQGTTAWLLGLIFFPFIAIPLFIIFGKKRLDDYQTIEKKVEGLRRKFRGQLERFYVKDGLTPLEDFLTRSESNFVGGNTVDLLLNGEETFAEMLTAIAEAKSYICLQTFIFRTDGIGTEFAQALMKRAREGVKIYFLYENLGVEVDEKVIDAMRRSGIRIGEFPPVRRYKLHLNFRNHRKLLITDGQIGIFGGINIGDDYLGRYPEIGFWRDTNVRVEGPAVVQGQIDFVKDWIWSQNSPVEIDWGEPRAAGDSAVLAMTSGPADVNHFNLLQHIEVINSSRRRLWIANPYFVPPQGLVDALLIAKMRGVDVRVIVPTREKCDNKLCSTAAEVYLEKLAQSKIRVHRYTRGMMHQKVILIDDSLAIVGSSNLDFRSMYINFENAIATNEPRFIASLEEAFHSDFKDSKECSCQDFESIPIRKKLASHFANCLAPIL